MPAPTTREQFLSLVRQSGLLTDKQLSMRIENAVTPLPAELRDAAALFVREGLLTTFQVQRLLWGQFRGFLLGNYKVLDQIGSGGMGNVYLCEHRSLGRRVAIKVLPPETAVDPVTVERFYREGQAVAALNHPNIVRAYDIDHVGNLHFLVMEYVEGTTLDRVIQQEWPLPIGCAADYIRQAALGLQHMHEARLVHRDIKPSNLLRDLLGVVKLLDLGLARFFASPEKESHTPHSDQRGILGTADYIAPEQCLNSHRVDIRADIYSLGATFYHLLAGQPPFEGTVAQKLIMQQTSDPTPIRQIRPEVPHALATILGRMLLKNPTRRFQTPAEVVAALAPICASHTQAPASHSSRASNRDIIPLAEEDHFSDPPSLDSIALGEGSTNHLSTGEQTSIFAWGQLAQEDSVYKPDKSQLRGLSNFELSMAGQVPASDQSHTRTRRRRLQYFVGVTVAFSAIAGIATWWLSGPSASAARLGRAGPSTGGSDSPSSAGASTLSERPIAAAPVVLQLASGGIREFTSVRDAMAQARPNCKIVLYGDVTEALALEGAVGHDVTIEAAPGREVRWRAPANLKEGQPLMQISGISGLRIKGLQLDGQKRVNDLIVLAGKCPGVTLEDVQFVNFKHSGVTLRSCRGDAGRPVTLARLRFVGHGFRSTLTAPEEVAQDGMRFAINAPRAGTGGDNRLSGEQYITIRRCRFEGPLRAAINFAAPVANVAITENRFYKLTNGLFYRKANPLHSLDVQLTGNTFCEVDTAVNFEVLPPTDGAGFFIVQNNLFVKTSRIAGVEGFTGEPAQVPNEWIWTSEARTFLDAPQGPAYFRKTFTLANGQVTSALLNVSSSEGFTIWVNGEVAGKGSSGTERVYTFDVSRLLHAGENTLAVESSKAYGPAGLLVHLSYFLSGNVAAIIVGSDGSWKGAKEAPQGWQRPGFDDSKWQTVKSLGKYGQGHYLWDSEIARRFPDQAARLVEAADQVAAAGRALEADTPEIRAAQAAWETEWHAKLCKNWSAWTALRPEQMTSVGGATLTLLDDLSVLASGQNPPQDVYTVTFRLDNLASAMDRHAVTGICLEALMDPSLGNQSVGRDWGGNFILTRLEMSVTTPGKSQPAPIKFAMATANFAQKDYAIANVINPDSNVGWAVEGNVWRLNRAAVFVLQEPIAIVPGTSLTIRLRCESKFDRHVIGRFRFYATCVDKPPLPEDNPLPADVKTILMEDPAQRSLVAQRRLAAYFRDTTPLLDLARKQLANRLSEREFLWTPFRGPAGNFRDGDSHDSYPLLKPAGVDVNLPTDPTNDVRFLRYEANHYLRQAGTNKSPVGIPQE